MIDENGRVHYETVKDTVRQQTHVSPYTNANNDGGARIESIEVLDREELVHAERARGALLYALLRGKRNLHEPTYDLVRLLYFSEDNEITRKPTRAQGAAEREGLNQCQANVVEAMIGSEGRFVLVHGEFR